MRYSINEQVTALEGLKMRHHLTVAAPLALLIAAFANFAMAAELLTIEQAEAVSKATGRPILAMAGTET